MRNSLLEELEENGFVVLDDFLSADDVAEINAAGRALSMDAPQEGRKVFSTINGTAAQNKENYFIDSGDKVRYFFEENALGSNGELLVDPTLALNKVGHALHTEHPIFEKITFSDRIKEICWQLGFRRPAVPQSMYIYKNPGVGGEVKSHQDASYLHTEPNSAIGFWIPLEDATLENGCLKFIKASHKSGCHRRYIRNPDEKSPEMLIYDRPAPIYPASSFTAVPVSKGSLVLIHGQSVHRSEPNKSLKSRHAYTFHVIETDNVKYSENNWLQPPSDKPFPVLYVKE